MKEHCGRGQSQTVSRAPRTQPRGRAVENMLALAIRVERPHTRRGAARSEPLSGRSKRQFLSSAERADARALRSGTDGVSTDAGAELAGYPCDDVSLTCSAAATRFDRDAREHRFRTERLVSIEGAGLSVGQQPRLGVGGSAASLDRNIGACRAARTPVPTPRRRGDAGSE